MESHVLILCITFTFLFAGCDRSNAEEVNDGVDLAVLIRHEWPERFILQYELPSGRVALLSVELLGVDVVNADEHEGKSLLPVDFSGLYGSTVEVRQIIVDNNVNKAQIAIRKEFIPTTIELPGVPAVESRERTIWIDPATELILRGSGSLVESEFDNLPQGKADSYRSIAEKGIGNK